MIERNDLFFWSENKGWPMQEDDWSTKVCCSSLCNRLIIEQKTVWKKLVSIWLLHSADHLNDSFHHHLSAFVYCSHWQSPLTRAAKKEIWCAHIQYYMLLSTTKVQWTRKVFGRFVFQPSLHVNWTDLNFNWSIRQPMVLSIYFNDGNSSPYPGFVKS